MVTALLYLCLSILGAEATNKTRYDVIVMGAGMAGISAAKALYESGISNILILEAQDYIGGRTKSIEFAGYTLNAGASWIAGACVNTTTLTPCAYRTTNQTNPMVPLALKYNVTFVVSNWDNIVILDFGGTVHNVSDSDHTFARYEDAQTCIQHLIANITAGVVEDMSYMAALYFCEWRAPLTAIEKSVAYAMTTSEFAARSRWISTYGSVGTGRSYEKYGDQDLFVTGKGYQGIALGLTSEFLDLSDLENETKLRLQTPVTHIAYDRDGGVTVRVEGGETFLANYGIVTFSLGVLQSDLVTFEPPLPTWKQSALLTMDFVDYTTIYVRWPTNFWHSYLDNDTEYVRLNDDRFGFFQWVYNLNHPRLYPGSLIWRFDISRELANMVQYQSVNDTLQQIIDLKLRHYFPEIVHIDFNEIEIYVAQWNANKYTQGSFSNWNIGLDDEDRDAMKWHLGKRLFFAGEAFHEDNGYVHGAYINGDEAAHQIMACMGHDDDGSECPQEYVPKTTTSTSTSGARSTLAGVTNEKCKLVDYCTVECSCGAHCDSYEHIYYAVTDKCGETVLQTGEFGRQPCDITADKSLKDMDVLHDCIVLPCEDGEFAFDSTVNPSNVENGGMRAQMSAMVSIALLLCAYYY